MLWKELNKGYLDQVTVLSSKTPYELLGVSSECSLDEVKAAYMRLVKVYHPDKADPFLARHNEEILKLINVAYEKLKEYLQK